MNKLEIYTNAVEIVTSTATVVQDVAAQKEWAFCIPSPYLGKISSRERRELAWLDRLRVRLEAQLARIEELDAENESNERLRIRMEEALNKTSLVSPRKEDKMVTKVTSDTVSAEDFGPNKECRLCGSKLEAHLDPITGDTAWFCPDNWEWVLDEPALDEAEQEAGEELDPDDFSEWVNFGHGYVFNFDPGSEMDKDEYERAELPLSDTWIKEEKNGGYTPPEPTKEGEDPLAGLVSFRGEPSWDEPEWFKNNVIGLMASHKESSSSAVLLWSHMDRLYNAKKFKELKELKGWASILKKMDADDEARDKAQDEMECCRYIGEVDYSDGADGTVLEDANELLVSKDVEVQEEAVQKDIAKTQKSPEEMFIVGKLKWLLALDTKWISTKKGRIRDTIWHARNVFKKWDTVGLYWPKGHKRVFLKDFPELREWLIYQLAPKGSVKAQVEVKYTPRLVVGLSGVTTRKISTYFYEVFANFGKDKYKYNNLLKSEQLFGFEKTLKEKVKSTRDLSPKYWTKMDGFKTINRK